MLIQRIGRSRGLANNGLVSFFYVQRHLAETRLFMGIFRQNAGIADAGFRAPIGGKSMPAVNIFYNSVSKHILATAKKTQCYVL
ncbi:MAG: hypothetical protein ACSLFJ_07805 [Immundisolibacter sp.]